MAAPAPTPTPAHVPAPVPFRVRYAGYRGGAFLPVLLAPGASEQGVEEVVAVRVGLAPETFGIRNADGVFSTFHAGLTGDWDVVLLPVPAARGASARVFEELVRAGGIYTVDDDVVARAKTRYAQRIGNALADQNARDAACIYFDAELLPSPATLASFEAGGLQITGPLDEGSALSVAYRGLDAYVVKHVSAPNAARLAALRAALAPGGGRMPRHTASFELFPTPAGRTFVVMPRFADTLARMPALIDAGAIATLWEHMSAALEDFHALGFAHGDVKPANVCIDHGAFYLIDLDSAARFGEPTVTTDEYLPSDERSVRVRASARADWWALAMTLAEKACGKFGLMLGSGTRSWTAAEVRSHLAHHLPPAVWAAIGPRIE